MLKILTLALIFASLTFLIPNNGLSCTMIKLSGNGKTIVGNNEDQMNPNTRIWFEKGKGTGFGAVYVGFDNLFPQGGMNEVGLVFDGFTQQFKAVSDTAGKLKIPSGDLSKKIMRECGTVDEIKNLINKYNRGFLSGAALRFVDKSGKYLYVDGDTVIVGESDFFVQTNIRPFENKPCWRYEKATRLLKNSGDISAKYCTALMDSVHQSTKWGGTIYTTVYDLQEGKIYLYYFYNYENVIIFDLQEELKKGDKVLNMPELFPQNATGQKYYTEYNRILTKIKALGESSLSTEDKSFQDLKNDISNSFIDKYPFYYKIQNWADHYLDEQTNYPRAILLLKMNVEIYPEDWRPYDNLAGAFLKNNQLREARDKYMQSLKLNPNNSNAKNRILYLSKIIPD
jgi:tetratricopeptide (TPR) repeat protein